MVRAGVRAAFSLIIGRLAVPMLVRRATAEAGDGSLEWRHGTSLFGELKYPAGFERFDYVNPAAPKLGVVRMMALGTFDNFNEVVAGAKGSFAAYAGGISNALMAPSLDEVGTYYGLIAEAVRHPDDFASATFRLRTGARHHDGKPVTVEDVIFSMEAFKNHTPGPPPYHPPLPKILPPTP